MLKKNLMIALIFGIVMSLTIGTTILADDTTPVTLTFFPQNYYDPSQHPDIANLVEQVVKSYEELHPNVKIELIPNFSSQDYETWLTAQFVAGKEPDIAWQQYYLSWNQPDLWISLNKYLDTPDEYATTGNGKEHWKDVLPSIVWETTISPNGNNYTINFDWVETGLYYNKTIFDKLGISPDFKTWDQFVQACKKIKAHGYVPLDIYMSTTNMSGTIYDWVDDITTTAAFADIVPQMYMEKYNRMYPQYYNDKIWRPLTTEEVVKAVYDKKYSAYDQRFVEFLKAEKEMSQYFPSGFTSLGQDGQMSLFLSGKSAMMWNGSWQMSAVGQGASFDWGLTYSLHFLPSNFQTCRKCFKLRVLE
jgi:raffinose/stachyose/melibiose transport system substrate-binding protein